MKKKVLFFLGLLLAVSPGFANNVIVINKTHKAHHSHAAVQWVATAKEVQESNEVSIRGTPLNQETLIPLKQSGKTTLSLPDKAAYFRVVAWSKEEGEPDYLTNWVDVVPNKTYTLKTEHLVPAVLILGSGC